MVLLPPRIGLQALVNIVLPLRASQLPSTHFDRGPFQVIMT